MSGPHALETSRPCSKCSTSEMVQYIWSIRVESCWDDVGGTGENAVSGGRDLLKVVEKKVLRSSDFCMSVLAVCSPCWSVGIVDCCLLSLSLKYNNYIYYYYYIVGPFSKSIIIIIIKKLLLLLLIFLFLLLLLLIFKFF